MFAFVGFRAADRFGVADRDRYLSARGTQGSGALALSFFASVLGAWILLSPPEVGTFGGALGVVGYAIGQAVAVVAFAWLGPAVRDRLPAGTTLLGWVSLRFGRPQHLWVTGISALYMFVFLTAELTGVGFVLSRLTGSGATVPILAVAAVTAAYTAYGGLPASLDTDRWQAWATLALVAIGVAAVVASVPDPVAAATAGGLGTTTRVGLETAIVLVIAITAANLFHQGFWQRVWAARDASALRRGAVGGGLLVVPLLLVTGAAGAVAAGRGTVEVPSLAFFSLLEGLPSAALVVVVALAVTLVASTADTLQNGLVSLVAADRLSLRTARWVTVALTVPAVLIAVRGLSVLRLFLVADLLAATVVVPVFLGLWRRVTTPSALAGSVTGLASVVVLGWIRDGGVVEGLRLLTLPGAVPDFGAFVVAPLASGAVTVLLALGSQRGRGSASGGREYLLGKSVNRS